MATSTNCCATPATSTIPNGRVRHELLNVLIRYYQLHVEQLGEIRSLDILSKCWRTSWRPCR